MCLSKDWLFQEFQAASRLELGRPYLEGNGHLTRYQTGTKLSSLRLETQEGRGRGYFASAVLRQDFCQVDLTLHDTSLSETLMDFPRICYAVAPNCQAKVVLASSVSHYLSSRSSNTPGSRLSRDQGHRLE
jgi:hypothetical protein